MTSIDTVNDLPPRVQYEASVGQTVFPYPFPIFQDADLVVDVDGVTQTLDTDYTVDGEGDDTGGDVTFVDALAGGEIVTIYRNIAIERDTDVSQNGPWSSTAYNDEQDKIFLILQQLKALQARSLRIPIISEVADADIELDPADFASMYLTFDANGKPTPAALVEGTVTAPIIGALLYPRSAAEIAAGVTPTDVSKPYGDWQRFGFSASETAANNVLAANKALLVGGRSYINVPGTYPINASLSVQSNSWVSIGAGVIIQSTGVVDWLDTGMLDIDTKINILIDGAGVLDGNKAANPAGRTFGVRIYNSTNIVLDGGVQANNCPGSNAAGTLGGDGLIVYGASTSRIYVGAWTFNANVRQGVSLVAGDYLTLMGTQCTNTSGTNPGAGVDAESDTPGDLKNVKLIGVNCDGNYVGFIGSGCDGLQIVGCTFTNSRYIDCQLVRVTDFFVDKTTKVKAVAPTVAQDAIFYVEDCQRGVIDAQIIGSADAQVTHGLRLQTGCEDIRIGASVKTTSGNGLIIGQTGMAEDIADINVAGGRYLDCTTGGSESVILISGDGTTYPRRITIDGVTVRDTRSAGAEAEYAVRVSTAIPSAALADYRIRNVNSTGTTAKFRDVPLWGEITWDPASLIDAAGETSANITVVGAVVGDCVDVFPGVALQGITHSAYVASAGVVNIRIQNESTATVDLGSSVWYVRARKVHE